MSNRPSPPPSDPEPPALTPETIADDEALAEAVDEFVRFDRLADERLHWIADHQELLRHAVDSDTWRFALQVDAAIVERWADVVVEIARWAFNEGRRYSLPVSREGAS